MAILSPIVQRRGPLSSAAGRAARLQSLEGALPDSTYTWWGPEDYFVVDQHPRGYARRAAPSAPCHCPMPRDDGMVLAWGSIVALAWA